MAVVATPVPAATWYAMYRQWRGLVVMLALSPTSSTTTFFATLFNRLFLVYVAAFSLIFATLAVLVTSTHVRSSNAPRVPAVIAIYAWVVVVPPLAWLGPVVPGLVAAYPPAFLQGTGRRRIRSTFRTCRSGCRAPRSSAGCCGGGFFRDPTGGAWLVYG
jgi:hypothetical protein